MITLLSILTLALSVDAAVKKIHRTGRYLFDEDGNRFYIKGLGYQEPGKIEIADNGFPEPVDYVDPLANPLACNRDLQNFLKLGINTIRVYNVDPTADHSACMNLLEDNGIYVIADLGLPQGGSLNRVNPTWDTDLYSQFTSTIKNLNQYPNLLAVNIGNEVVTAPEETIAAPYLKAIVRDIKAYVKSINSTVLVGYAAVDKNAGANGFRDRLAALLTCDDEESSVDIYGLNTYRWCGKKTYANSGYASITNEHQNLPVPAYLSEIGCATSPPRLWTETQAVMSNPMAEIFSGFIAFEYFADDVDEGMTEELTDNNSSKITTTADFDRLAAQIATGSVADPPVVAESSAQSLPLQECPTKNDNWLASNEVPPSADPEVCSCLVQQTFSCVANANTSPAIVGALIDYTCQLPGVSCDDIAGNSTTGVYGKVSFCSSSDKLSYLFTQYYESQGRLATACDFGGNATTVAAISSSAINKQAACLSKALTVSGGANSSDSASTQGSGSEDSAASSISTCVGVSTLFLVSLAFVLG